MKNLFLIGFLLALTFSLSAQDFGDESSSAENADIVAVVDVSGKAKYKAPDSKRFKKVKAGAVLEKSGTVKLKKNTNLSLVYQGKPADISGKGTHALESISTDATAEADDFMAFLSEASGFAGPGGGPNPGKDTTSTPEGSGHGEGKAIQGTQPLGGHKVTAKPTTFKWTKGNVPKYTFKLYQGNGSTPLISEEVMTNELKVNLADIQGIQMGKMYKYQIETTTDEGITRKSPGVEFTLMSMDDSDKLLRELRTTEAYRKAAPWEKRLREVHVLKSKGFTLEAKAVAKMCAKQFPKNKIIKGAVVALE